MNKQLNPFNLCLIWRWSLKFEYGYHPSKESPIYEYWRVGPIELQSFFRQSEPVEYLSVELFRSNDRRTCANCDAPITEENDSRWEVFVGDGTLTQPQCKECRAKWEAEAYPDGMPKVEE